MDKKYLQVLVITLLFVIGYSYIVSKFAPPAPSPSIAPERVASLAEEVKVEEVVLEDEDDGCMYMELMRADMTGDGNEDILVFVYDYATRGTFGAGSTGILSRGSDDAMFAWHNTVLGTRSRSSA